MVEIGCWSGCVIIGLAFPPFVYAGADCQLPHAAWLVLEKYPGLGVYTMSPIPPPVGEGSGGDLLPECRVLALHGRPMNSAAASDQAAVDWMTAYKDAFGVANVNLPFTRKISFGTPGPNMQPATVATMTTYYYQQYLDGVLVEGGQARVVVSHGAGGGSPHQVVFATAGGLVRTPVGGFPPDTITGPQALAIVQALLGYETLDEFGPPELVIIHLSPTLHPERT